MPIRVFGCAHMVAGPWVNGVYEEIGWHHGKPSFKKAMIGNGPAAHVYFWDGRDGPSNWGWWVGPKIGGDDVWAYNPTRNGSSKNKNPPCTGWQVPPGLPDEELFVEELPAPPPSAVLGWERKSTVRKDGRTRVSWKPILEETHPLLKKRRIVAEKNSDGVGGGADKPARYINLGRW